MKQLPIEQKIPYNFARKYNMVAAASADGVIIYHLPLISLSAIAEINRFFSGPLIFKEVTENEFQQHLAQCYQSKSSISDAAETMESDIDLSQLANQLPTSEDLLDNNDDAPIIRLINALFTQAIK